MGFVFAQQIASGFVRRRDKRNVARELAHLRKSHWNSRPRCTKPARGWANLAARSKQRGQAQGKKIVAELQVLESLMREFAGQISRSAAAAVPQPETQAAARARRAPMSTPWARKGELLETIRSSLEENRVDLYLQPIVSLPQRKLRYYEALSRLRAEDGSVIMPAQYIKVAAPGGPDERGGQSAAVPLRADRAPPDPEDAARSASSATSPATRWRTRNSSPSSWNTCRPIATWPARSFSNSRQDAVLKAGAEGEKNLRRLSDLGFALSMDHVETLALDFLRLKALGFRHIKVRAATLMRGMDGPAPRSRRKISRSCSSRHGLNLIAERVEDEKTVVQLLDYSRGLCPGLSVRRAARGARRCAQAGVAGIAPSFRSEGGADACRAASEPRLNRHVSCGIDVDGQCPCASA